MPEAAAAQSPGPAPAPPPSGVFPGWWVVAALFVILMTASGLAFYNLQVFLHALTQEGVIGLNLVSWAIGFFFVVNGLAGLGVSVLLERFPARYVIAVGGVVAGASLAFLGRVADTTQLFVVFGILGLGFPATSLIPAMTVVTRWFVERRSVAVSVVSTGLSLGGILFTPVCARAIELHGFAAVSHWIGLAYVVGVVPLALLLVRDQPEPTAGQATSADDAPPPGVAYRDAVSSRYFVWLGAAYVGIMLAQVGVLQHLYNAVAARVDTEFARRVIQILAGSSVVGRFAGGFILLRVPIRPATAVLIAVQGLALGSLAYATTPGAIAISVVGFGLVVGNLLMIQPLLLATAFGVREYGRIYSTSQLVSTVGYATGPGVVALLSTRFGGYDVAFAVAAGASALALLCLALAGRPAAEH